jgi:protoporphyrinogen oxidase
MGQRVAVIGAGPMGLAVAYQLVQDGHEPVVYEADDRVGGMTACFDFSGLTIERFYHFHCISDHAFFQVLDELGLSHKLHWVETKMGYWYQNRLQAWGNPIALLRFQGLSLWAKFRYGLHAFAATKRSRWEDLDQLEATAWIRKWVGAEAYEVLWRRLFDYKFYEHAQSLSAAWIWSRIRRIGRSRYNLFKEKLGYLDGGSQTLLDGLRQHIESKGGVFRLRCPIERIVTQEGQVLGVQVQGKLEHFDKVISTVPLPFLPQILPDLPPSLLAQYQSVKNVAVVCAIVKLKRAVTDNFWLNTNDPDMDIPGLVEYTNLRPLDHHVVYAPYYVPGDHPLYAQPDAHFIDKVSRYLKKINPLLRDDDFIDIRINRYRYAQPVCGPGFANSLPPVALPIKGLWAADTSYYYPEDRGISESIAFGRQLAKLI